MIKIVCLFAIICAMSVQGEECVDKTKPPSKEVVKIYQECKQEVKDDMKKMPQCTATKSGSIDANGNIVYDNFVKYMSSTITSENKRKIIVAEIGKCKEKDPNLGKDFLKCFGTAYRKECSP